VTSPLAFAHGCPRNPSAESTALTDPDIIRAGLTVHTFETDTPSCGSIVRRYLAYVPPALPSEARAHVLIVLHGGPDRAENMRSIQTQRRFETLAARERFIVVYASAVASQDSDPLMQNEGRWRTPGYERPEVDDEVYLLRIAEDLLTRRVIDGTNSIFLVGHGEGANMALQAAAHRPDFYAGVAAFMAYPPLGSPLPSQNVAGARLSRALFVVRDGGGMPMAKRWALSLGVPPEAVEAPRDIELPNRVVEGKSHARTGALARGVRNSTVRRVDLWSAENAQRAVRVFDIKHGGIFWPTLAPNDDERWIRDFGLRNQDIDGAEETWKFLSGAEPRVPGAFADDEDVVLDAEAVRETPF
jgi:poly(3-hydroxybutyrate) depolymerase